MWANDRETHVQEQPLVVYYFRVCRLVWLSPICPVRQRVEAVRQSSPHCNPVELRAVSQASFKVCCVYRKGQNLPWASRPMLE